jgi:hypothetical protein
MFSARDGDLIACVHADLTEPGGLSISFAHRNDLIMLGIDINIKRWGEDRTVFITYGAQGDSRWVTLKSPEDFDGLIAVINETLGRLDIKDKVGVNIANLIRSVLEDPKRYYALAPGSAYEACDIGAESPREIQPSKHETFLGLNGANVTEGSFMAQVRVPNEDTIDITIRRRDAEDSPVVHIRLDIVRGKGTRFRTRAAVYLVDKGGTTEVKTLDRPDAEELLKYARVLLHTNRQGLPSNGRIAGLLEEAITQAVSEAKRRTREFRARIGEELYQQALKEPGLKEDPLRLIIDTLGYPHAGDEVAKKIGVLAIVSSRLPETYRLSVLFIAPSGRGKTNLLRALEAVTPRAWRLFEAESLGSSPLAVFYHALMKTGFVFDMRRKIWFINEPSWLLLGQGEDPGKRLMKQVISDVTDRERKCYDTVITINNTRRAIKLCLRGRPVIFATIQDKYSHMLDEQITSRMLPVPLDPSRDVLGRVVYHIVYDKTNPEVIREFRRRTRLIRAFLAREIPRVNEVVFTEDAKAKIMKCSNLDNPSLCDGHIGRLLGILETESVITRATEALRALAASIALLKRRFEKRDGRVVLTVTEDDVDEAWDIAKPIIESMAFGTNPLYNLIKQAILEILRAGPARRKDIVDAIKQRYNVKRGWIDDVLRALVRFEIIEKCDEGIYAITCPKSSEITKYTNEDQGEGGDNES